jgi:hypothetical protein
MKIITLKWNNVTSIILLATVMILLFLAMSWAANQLMASVGWHELASVGWVATPV